MAHTGSCYPPRMRPPPESPWIARSTLPGDVLIGLIADTHIPEARATLWEEAYRALEGVDAILHAGDMHDVVVLDWLERVAPVIAVRGNGDDGGSGRPVQPHDPRLAHNQLVSAGDLRIGMTHTFNDLTALGTSVAQQIARHFGEPVDVVVAGDTHVPEVTELGSVLLVNPGSPTLPRNLQTQLGTIGFLEVRAGRVADVWIELLH